MQGSRVYEFGSGALISKTALRGSQSDGEAIDPKIFQATLQLLELLKPN